MISWNPTNNEKLSAKVENTERMTVLLDRNVVSMTISPGTLVEVEFDDRSRSLAHSHIKDGRILGIVRQPTDDITEMIGRVNMILKISNFCYYYFYIIS